MTLWFLAAMTLVAVLAASTHAGDAGMLAGTRLGERVLLGMSAERFRRAVSLAILALGVLLLVRTL